MGVVELIIDRDLFSSFLGVKVRREIDFIVVYLW